MSATCRIFVGDLVNALEYAGDADAANWPRIAAMLGFRFGETSLTQAAQPAAETIPNDLPAVERGKLPDSASKPPEIPPEDEIELIDFTIARSTAPPETLPAAGADHSRSESTKPLPLLPLLNPVWERSVLIEAVGKARAEGEPDVPEMVQLLARGFDWSELPVLKIQSVSQGCQVLIDAGLGMQPFSSDTQQLLRSLRRIVGSERVQVLTFVDCPSRGVLSEGYEDRPYTPPEHGGTVVVLSDLCAGGPQAAIREATPEEWVAIARLARRAGAAFIVLDPYPSSRWPSSLVERIPILHWDRATEATAVRRKRRRFKD